MNQREESCKRVAGAVALVASAMAILASGGSLLGAGMEPDFLREEAGVQLVPGAVSVVREKDELMVVLPLVSTTPGKVSVDWRVSITQLDGTELSSDSGTARIMRGDSVIEARLPDPVPAGSAAEDVQYVVRYKLGLPSGTEAGRRSLFALLPRPAVAARVPDELFAGGVSRVPVLVTDGPTGKPLRGRDVVVTMKVGDGPESSVSGRTDAAGLLVVDLPVAGSGTARVRTEVSSDGVVVGTEASARVVHKTRVLVTLDKPMYQPGQTMHLRALALRRPDGLPDAGLDLVFEVSDSKGNKVFKKAAKAGQFGVAFADFTLGNQVNLGTYTVTVVTGEDKVEKAVTVDRYVLPKFKVDVNLDKPFYLAGDRLSATLSANYFFGKPVSGGTVRATIYDYQAQWVPTAVIEGKMNDEGVYALTYTLPRSLVGQPLEGGNALMLAELVVTDTAGHVQKESRQVVVAQQPLQLALFPESGAIVPGVQNTFYLLMSDPVGNPVAGSCVVEATGPDGRIAKLSVTVDDSGLGQLSVTPKGASLDVSVTGESGAGASTKGFHFEAQAADAGLLVRPTATILRTGDELSVDVLAAAAASDAFLDVTRDGQTLAVGTVRLAHGRGSYALPLDAGMTGTLTVSAYVLSQRGEYTRDSRVVFVKGESDLRVKMETDRSVYRPGETAAVTYAVTDAEDKPVAAALGIQVVDEAVFALSQSRPGLMKLFFALEEALQKPTYQVGPGAGLSFGQLLFRADAAPDAVREKRFQDDAAMTLAAAGDVAVRTAPRSSWSETRAGVQSILDGYFQNRKYEIAAAVAQNSPCSDAGWQRFSQGSLDAFDEAVERDPWGKAYRLRERVAQVDITSAGPDRRFGTWDDQTMVFFPADVCSYGMVREARFGGGGGWDDGMIPMAMPAAAEAGGAPDMAMKLREEEAPRDTATATTEGGKTAEPVRVRKWFPETLFVEPNLLTDEQGKARVEIPLADSITTWRMSAVGSDARGRIGGGDAPIKVFQDFFVDVDFPVFLTRNDEVSFPIAVYNYLDREQVVDIQLDAGDWYEALGKSGAKLTLAPGEVAGVRFPVRVTRVGWHSLTVTGRGSEGFADAVKKTVQVRPDGREVLASSAGKFKTGKEGEGTDTVTLPLDFPPDAVEGSPQALVQVLPGLTSHVVQGMDSMLRLPGG